MKTMLRPEFAHAAKNAEQAVDLGRRERGGGFVEDDDACARKEHARDLDQLLQADRQVADALVRIDIDAERGELLARGPRHVAPPYDAETVRRLVAEEDVFGDRQIRRDAQLLVHHCNAGSEGVAGRAQPHLATVDHVGA